MIISTRNTGEGLYILTEEGEEVLVRVHHNDDGEVSFIIDAPDHLDIRTVDDSEL